MFDVVIAYTWFNLQVARLIELTDSIKIFGLTTMWDLIVATIVMSLALWVWTKIIHGGTVVPRGLRQKTNPSEYVKPKANYKGGR